MNWSWGSFWAMGGAGFFVWGSYGAVVLAVSAEILSVRAARKAARALAAAHLEDEPA